MARLECRSSQPRVSSEWVEVDNISDAQVVAARARLDVLLEEGHQISTAVAIAFEKVSLDCPMANPSDLWHHVIYRHLLESGWSDQRWKRVSGFALERALVSIYQARLTPYGVRMSIMPAGDANKVLSDLGLDTRSTKIDLFLQGQVGTEWLVFGAVHVKSSIAERIQDDVPASRAFMDRGLLSIALTMDAKSYPPPHGNCINYGELGGRSVGVEKDRLKRGYIENTGQFDALFSFNLRTPPSEQNTSSGKRIRTMSLHKRQPDAFVSFVADRWASHPKTIEV